MKITRLRVAMLAVVAFVASFTVSTTPVSAGSVYVGVRVGGPPPPPPIPAHVYQPWARPYRSAVWIPGHQEWIRGRWVWVGGYYAYPPRRHAVWIQPAYRGGYYYRGYWR